MASPTPGYCTLTATARSAPRRRVDGDGAVDLADRRRGDRLGIPLDEHLLGRAPELALDDLGGQLGRHRRGVGLQRGERLAHRFGQAVVEVAGHLADLHQGALHVAEALGDLLGAAQLALVVELGPPLGGGEQLAGRRAWRTSTRRPSPRRASSTLRPARRRAADRSDCARRPSRATATATPTTAAQPRAPAATRRGASASSARSSDGRARGDVVAGLQQHRHEARRDGRRRRRGRRRRGRPGRRDALEQLDLPAHRARPGRPSSRRPTSGRRSRRATRRSGTRRAPGRPRAPSASRAGRPARPPTAPTCWSCAAGTAASSASAGPGPASGGRARRAR